MVLSAIASEAVDEGIAEDLTSVRKVEGVGTGVADARAVEAVVRRVRRVVICAFMFKIEYMWLF